MALVDTSKVEGRREVRYASIADVLADADALAAAERAGKLKAIGNWTLGQAMGHVASWINFAYDGYPASIKPPWIIKFILKFMKAKYIKGPMPRGVKIPRTEVGTLATEVLPLEEGLAKYRAAWKRLEAGCPTQESPIFGKIPHNEWIALNMRHAELHMGYFIPS